MPMHPPVPAPRCDTSGTAVAMYVIADVSALSADPDLAQLEDYPAWCPQKLTLLATDAAQSITLTDEDGFSFTFVLAQGIPFITTRPIRTIDESATDAVQVIAEWFDPAGSNAWNA